MQSNGSLKIASAPDRDGLADERQQASDQEGIASEVAPPFDDARFRHELHQTVASLRAFARGLCGNNAMADDLAQEALLKAWAARTSFRQGTNLKAWIFTILRNHYFTQRQRNARFAQWDPEIAERSLVSAPSQGNGLDLKDLYRGLQTLSPEQREALLLVGAAGVSYEEAAEICGCVIGTIKSRVARARAALKNYMEGDPRLLSQRAQQNLQLVD